MVTFSWVKEMLDQQYPGANWARGVDLNKDGKIQAAEKIRDFDKDGEVGSPGDWQKFRQNNAKALQRNINFFRVAAESHFTLDNPIHDVLAIEYHLVSKDQVEWVYLTAAKVLKKVREDNLQLIDAAIRQSGITVVNFSRSVTLTQDLGRNTVAPDSLSLIKLAVGHELGLPPQHGPSRNEITASAFQGIALAFFSQSNEAHRKHNPTAAFKHWVSANDYYKRAVQLDPKIALNWEYRPPVPPNVPLMP